MGPLVRIDGRVNSERYIEEILAYHVLPFLEEFEEKYGEYFFQQDNAPIHTSRKTRTFIEETDIILLPWPGQSPDLNPIEHIWDELERNIRSRKENPKNINELEAFLQESWLQISNSIYQKLVDSMENWVKAILKSRGFPIRY